MRKCLTALFATIFVTNITHATSSNADLINANRNGQDLKIDVDEMIKCNAYVLSETEGKLYYSYYFDDLKKEYFLSDLGRATDLKYYYHSCVQNGRTCLEAGTIELSSPLSYIEATNFGVETLLADGTWSYNIDYFSHQVSWDERNKKFKIVEWQDSGVLICSRSLDNNFLKRS